MSVGLPVHNAEVYLREALDSLVTQEYGNLELIISDNGSTDGTEDICREYVGRDRRIRYQREQVNRGAVWNFNRVLELAQGKYFMWAAFDDRRDPTYVLKCVAALESHPGAVLCCTDIRFIDERGSVIDPPSAVVGLRPLGPTPALRVRAIARAPGHWYDIYGLARREALARTRLGQPVWAFDVVLLLELCLQGDVVLVPEPLFYYRRFSNKTEDVLASGISSPAQAVSADWSEMALEMIEGVRRSPLSRWSRLRIGTEVGLWLCVLNRPVREAIRRDLGVGLRRTVSGRNLAGSLVLLAMAAVLYPLYNPLTRLMARKLRSSG